MKSAAENTGEGIGSDGMPAEEPVKQKRPAWKRSEPMKRTPERTAQDAHCKKSKIYKLRRAAFIWKMIRANRFDQKGSYFT